MTLPISCYSQIAVPTLYDEMNQLQFCQSLLSVTVPHRAAHRNEENAVVETDVIFDDEDFQWLARCDFEFNDEALLDVPREAPVEQIAHEAPLEDGDIAHESSLEDEDTVHEAPLEDEDIAHEASLEDEDTAHEAPLDDTAETRSPHGRLSCLRYVNYRYNVGVNKKTRTEYQKNWKNNDNPDTAICDGCSRGRLCSISDLNGKLLHRMVTVKDTTRNDKILVLKREPAPNTFTCVKYVQTRYHNGPLRAKGSKARHLRNWKSRENLDSVICRGCGRGQACNLSDLNRAMLCRTISANDTTRLERIRQIGGDFYVDRRAGKNRWKNSKDPYAEA
ncbi:hypothetical protein CYMTET_56093 [Cymbomonas tetramitiformis]|uniref:Uncharacterized protein n=1 Tax=Cymbomonas tetramitiformis TaxID=36881 RepID=A0AAE0BC20_9CHLO|nr:hypothetical protein CYMTET_56093 [Cymbomonas tetramitiformis]